MCLVLVLAALPASAQTFRDWQVVRGDAGCIASISIGLAGPDSGLATFTAFPHDTGGVVTVRVPLGAYLPAGIAYSHPGRKDAVGLAWQSCDTETCLAAGIVSKDEIARLKAGRAIYLGFQPLPDSRALISPISLLGFTRAWEAAAACE